MRAVLFIAFCALAMALTVPARAADCAAIADATVAELRAGSPAWSDEQERLARHAAGAACVKARAAGTAAGGSAQRGQPLAVEEATAAAGGRGRDAKATADDAIDAEATDGKSDDEKGSAGFWPSLKRNDVSGLPGKKPYQRKERD